MKSKKEILTELQQIPGVGPSIALDLWDLDIRSIADLADKNPEIMYKNLCTLHKTHLDRCLLYVFRCAVYYASEKSHNPELLKWWNWKDR
jgi:hypothetical protein